MYKGILHTHNLVVTLFLLIYVIKTILLLSNKNDLLATFSRKVKIFEIIVSALFLLTGIYLTMQLPFNGKFDYLFWIKLVMVFAAIPIAIIGFKKNNKILAALSLLLITGSYGIAEVYGKRKGIAKNYNSEMATTETDAQKLYALHCTNCHGADGKAGKVGARDLALSTLDVAGIKDVILNGKGNMPAVKVTDTQAAAVAEYVNSNFKAH